MLYFVALMATFVSVALYVSINTAKVGMTFFMSSSLDMYDPVSDTPARVRAAGLHHAARAASPRAARPGAGPHHAPLTRPVRHVSRCATSS